MRKLDLVGLDSGGRYLVFADETGSDYVAPADDRLRAALRGDRARLGQLEIDMDSALRPRDIQARIRSGESPEAVATVAQVSVDKIMAYCVPVLAERRHIADVARREHVRRRNADGPACSLDTVVSERLRSRAIDPDSATWDAWRRDDGRWLVRTTYHSGEREHTADFVFDSVGRYCVAADDEAKWLTGEQQSTRKGPQPREPGGSGQRRLSSVRAGDDLLSLSDAAGDVQSDEELSDDLTAVVRAISEPASEEWHGVEPADAAHPVADAAHPVAEAGAERVGDAASEPLPDGAAEPARSDPGPPDTADSRRFPHRAVDPTPDRRRRAARRASVPSWDEIMFGRARDQER